MKRVILVLYLGLIICWIGSGLGMSEGENIPVIVGGYETIAGEDHFITYAQFYYSESSCFGVILSKIVPKEKNYSYMIIRSGEKIYIPARNDWQELEEINSRITISNKNEISASIGNSKSELFNRKNGNYFTGNIELTNEVISDLNNSHFQPTGYSSFSNFAEEKEYEFIMISHNGSIRGFRFSILPDFFPYEKRYFSMIYQNHEFTYKQKALTFLSSFIDDDEKDAFKDLFGSVNFIDNPDIEDFTRITDLQNLFIKAFTNHFPVFYDELNLPYLNADKNFYNSIYTDSPNIYIKAYIQWCFAINKPLLSYVTKYTYEKENKEVLDYNYKDFRDLTAAEMESIGKSAKKYLTWGVEYTPYSNDSTELTNKEVYKFLKMHEENWFNDIGERENNYLPYEPAISDGEETPFYLIDSEHNYEKIKRRGNPLPYARLGIDSPRTFNYKMNNQLKARLYLIDFPDNELETTAGIDNYGICNYFGEYVSEMDISKVNGHILDMNRSDFIYENYDPSKINSNGKILKPFLPGLLANNSEGIVTNGPSLFQPDKIAGVDSVGILAGSLAMSTIDLNSFIDPLERSICMELDKYYKMQENGDGLDSNGKPAFFVRSIPDNNQGIPYKSYLEGNYRFSRGEIEAMTVIVPDLENIVAGDLVIKYNGNNEPHIGVVTKVYWKEKNENPPTDQNQILNQIEVVSVRRGTRIIDQGNWGNNINFGGFTLEPKEYHIRRLLLKKSDTTNEEDGKTAELIDPAVKTRSSWITDERHKASCFNFTEGGVKYDFKIINGKVYYWIDNYFMGEFSKFKGDTYASYITYNNKKDGEIKNILEDNIYFDMIAADNNRVFAHAIVNGKHKFFWAQLVDEFPNEYYKQNVGERSIPGFYAKVNPEDPSPGSNYNDIVEEYDEHPVMFNFTFFLAKMGTPQDLKVVKVESGIWHEIHAQPPEEIDSNQDRIPKNTFDEVIDIGVSNPHRYERYKYFYGGEIHANIYPILNFEEKDVNPYDIFPNLRVLDGGSFIDGTCNFYVIAKAKHSFSLFPESTVVLWIDEQEYFSEYWRVIHPDDSDFKTLFIGYYTPVFTVAGESFKNTYASPYGSADILNNESRMAVSRYAVLVTVEDKIFSTSFMWGVTDKTWRYRNYPQLGPCLKDTIQIRDDTTILLNGFYDYNSDGIEEEGYWYQKYLPANHLDVKGEQMGNDIIEEYYDHRWKFISKEAFEVTNSYYNFGIYDNSRPNPERKNYYYKGIEDRNQYFRIRIRNFNEYNINKENFYNTVWTPANNKNYYMIVNYFFNDFYYKKTTRLRIIGPDPVNANSFDQFIAVYDHLIDDDMDRTEEEIEEEEGEQGTYYYKCNYDSGNSILNSKDEIEIEILERIEDWTAPVVQEASVTLDVGTSAIEVQINSNIKKYDNDNSEPDKTIKYVSIGAIDYNGTPDIIINRSEINLDQKTEYRFSIDPIKRWLIKKYFEPGGKEQYGLSVWFEDIAGHKSVAQWITTTLEE